MKDEAVTKAEFARRLGCRRSYVSQLASQGRLVLTDDGKRVWDAASRQRLAETADPAKVAVAQRHAEARGAALPLETSADEESGGEMPAGAPLGDEAGYAQWRARHERSKALAAERELALSMAELLVASEVQRAVASAFASIRVRLEALPDVIAAEVSAMRDESQVRARLQDEMETVLAHASRELEQLGGVK